MATNQDRGLPRMHAHDSHTCTHMTHEYSLDTNDGGGDGAPELGYGMHENEDAAERGQRVKEFKGVWSSLVFADIKLMGCKSLKHLYELVQNRGEYPQITDARKLNTG